MAPPKSLRWSTACPIWVVPSLMSMLPMGWSCPAKRSWAGFVSNCTMSDTITVTTVAHRADVYRRARQG